VLRQAVPTNNNNRLEKTDGQERDNHQKLADLMLDEELVVGFLPSRVAK
jgi:hypothetical protein